MISLVDLHCRHDIVSNSEYQGILGNSLGLAKFLLGLTSVLKAQSHISMVPPRDLAKKRAACTICTTGQTTQCEKGISQLSFIHQPVALGKSTDHCWASYWYLALSQNLRRYRPFPIRVEIIELVAFTFVCILASAINVAVSAWWTGRVWQQL